jgi:hypothetical protein
MPVILVAPTTGTHWLCQGTLRRKLLDPKQIQLRAFFGARIVKAGGDVNADDLLAWIRSYEDVDNFKVK